MEPPSPRAGFAGAACLCGGDASATDCRGDSDADAWLSAAAGTEDTTAPNACCACRRAVPSVAAGTAISDDSVSRVCGRPSAWSVPYCRAAGVAVASLSFQAPEEGAGDSVSVTLPSTAGNDSFDELCGLTCRPAVLVWLRPAGCADNSANCERRSGGAACGRAAVTPVELQIGGQIRAVHSQRFSASAVPEKCLEPCFAANTCLDKPSTILSHRPLLVCFECFKRIHRMARGMLTHNCHGSTNGTRRQRHAGSHGIARPPRQ